MYLHELRRIIRETEKDQNVQRKKTDLERAQLFSPTMPVIPEYGFDVVLIHRWICLTDEGGDLSFFKVTADFLLVGKRYLRIGNHRRQKKSMGRSAFRAFDPADTEPDSPGGQFYSPPVITMDRQTGRMRAGTGQLMKLKMINNRIVKGLGNLIAIPDKNGYHSIVNRHRFSCGCEQ